MTFVRGFAVVSSSGEWVLESEMPYFSYLQFQETGFSVAGGLWHDVPQMIIWRCDYLDLQSNVPGSEVLFYINL